MVLTLTELLGSKLRNATQLRKALAAATGGEKWGVMTAGRPQCKVIVIKGNEINILGTVIPIYVLARYYNRMANITAVQFSGGGMNIYFHSEPRPKQLFFNHHQPLRYSQHTFKVCNNFIFTWRDDPW